MPECLLCQKGLPVEVQRRRTELKTWVDSEVMVGSSGRTYPVMLVGTTRFYELVSPTMLSAASSQGAASAQVKGTPPAAPDSRPVT